MLTIPAFTVFTATRPGSVTPSWRTARGMASAAGENMRLWQLGFSLCFFGVVLYFSLRPSRILDSVGKFLNPAFLLFLGIMLAAALIRPVQTAASVVPLFLR